MGGGGEDLVGWFVLVVLVELGRFGWLGGLVGREGVTMEEV